MSTTPGRLGRSDAAELWADLLTTEDLQAVRRGRFARRVGFGDQAAVIVIDAQNYMIGPVGDETFAYPSSCGPRGREAVGRIAALLRVARTAGVPIFYTRFEVAADGSDMGIYRFKRDFIESEGWCLRGSFGARIADAITPERGDFVLTKPKPSAFFGTPLLSRLIDLKVDTVILTGGSTSNCVRATAVDAASLNLRVIIPAQCVFDRIEISHRIALFDLDRQYADVMTAESVKHSLVSSGAETKAGPEGP